MNKIYTTVGITALIVAGGAASFYFSKDTQEYDFFEVERGDIVEEVSVTGRVKASEDVELAFEISGRINNFYVSVGDGVKAGNRLVSVSGADLLARIDQYSSAVATQQAKLDELKAGVRPEEIDLQKVKIENAEISLNDSKSSLINSIKDAYVKSDDAIRNKVDQFISGPATSNPQLTFTINDIALEAAIESGRKNIEVILNSWKLSVDALTTGDNMAEKTKEARDNLSEITLFLDNVALAINSSTIGLSGNTWKADVSAARTSVASATSNLLTTDSAHSTAVNNLAVTKSELALKEAGATNEQISAQEAQVAQARAQLRDAQAAFSKTIITAPISGIVTDVSAKTGEIVSPNSPVISLISEGLQIEANLPEADIAKVKIGNETNVTLDAYGRGLVFKANITKIDPAEVIIEGVATYKITLQFTEEDERVRPGMTANIDIKTNISENTLFVPQRAVITRGTDRFVRILAGEGVVEKEVQTGLRGVNGNIEIISGIEEGDKIITLIRE